MGSDDEAALNACRCGEHLGVGSHPLEQRDEHRVGAIAVRPELRVQRATCKIKLTSRDLVQHALRVDLSQLGVALQQPVEHDPGLGAMRRAGDVGEQTARGKMWDSRFEQLALIVAELAERIEADR